MTSLMLYQLCYHTTRRGVVQNADKRSDFQHIHRQSIHNLAVFQLISKSAGLFRSKLRKEEVLL